MDASTRYSHGAVVESTNIAEAILYFEMLWATRYGYPNNIVYDKAFDCAEFKEYISKTGIIGNPVPSRRHNKNVLESKHKVLRDIYMRLGNENNDCPRILIQHMFRISNLLYGNDVMSTYELAHGTCPSVMGNQIISIPDELQEAHRELKAKRKLKKVLSSKSVQDIPVHAGDIVDVFVKLENQKRGKWLREKSVLSYDPKSRSISYAGKNGRMANAAIEDVRLSLSNDGLAKSIKDAIDTLDEDMDWLIEDGDSTNFLETSNDNSFLDSQMMKPDLENMRLNPKVSDRIKVFWPDDEQFYVGTVSSFDPESGLHTVNYDDGDTEDLVMSKEIWEHIDKSQNSNAATGTIELTPVSELHREDIVHLKRYKSVFGTGEFTASNAQGLPQSVVKVAYVAEEQKFLKHV